MLQNLIVTGFSDDQVAAVLAYRYTVGVVETADQAASRTGGRVESVNIAVSPVFKNIQQACLVGTAEFGGSELLARLAEVNDAIRPDGEIICVFNSSLIDCVQYCRN